MVLAEPPMRFVKAATTSQHFNSILSEQDLQVLSIGHHHHASTITSPRGIRPGGAYDIIAIDYLIFLAIAAVSKCFDSRNSL